MPLDVYAPKDVEKIKKERYGIKTVEEWGEQPYVGQRDLAEDYDMVLHIIHQCPVCGKEMKIIDEESLPEGKLPCPRCKHLNTPSGVIFWD